MPHDLDSQALALAVDRAYTGNRSHDLAGFSLSQFADAEALWLRVAARRYEQREHDSRKGLRV